MNKTKLIGLIGIVIAAILVLTSFYYLLLPDSEPVIDKSIIAEYHFDEGVGNVALDSSIYNLNGTIMGANWTTGISGHALVFDGIDDYVVFNNSVSVANHTELTIGAWVNITSTNDYHHMIVYNQLYSFYMLALTRDMEANFTVMLNYSDDFSPIVNSPVLKPNTWHYIVGVYNNDSIMMYVDGELVESKSVPQGYIRYAEKQHHSKLYIGGLLPMDYMGGPYVYHRFNGTIDEITIYSRALSAEEVHKNYSDCIQVSEV